MNVLWQQIVVGGLIVIATIFVIYSGISAWRALSRGQCRSCSSCGGKKATYAPTSASEPKGTPFIPADDLRTRLRSRR